MKNNSMEKGFTFAESLITLVIVGVVAALVIPTVQYGYKVVATQAAFTDAIKEFNKGLFNYVGSFSSEKNKYEIETTYNADKEEYIHTRNVSEEKAEKTTLATVFSGSLAEVGLFSDEDPSEKLVSQFHPVKVGRDCWDGIPIKNDFNQMGESLTDLSNISCFIDRDNTIYAIERLSADCSTDLYNKTAGKRHKLQNSCAILYVDVNGQTSPNTFGRDIFAFVITNSNNTYLYPVGGKLMKTIIVGQSAMSEGSLVGSWVGSCDAEHHEGRTCAGRLVEEGMKIKYWN